MKLWEEGIAGTVEFNALAGNLENITEESLIAQAKVVREEGIELFDAVDNKEGPEQILKEAIDVLVTIHGFVSMLQIKGYDVCGAWKDVNENNLSKFPKDYVTAHYSQLAYLDDSVQVEVIKREEGCYVLKDDNGKIRKPIGYQKPNLKKYLPKED